MSLLNDLGKAASPSLFPQYTADSLIRTCHPGASSPPAGTLAFGQGGCRGAAGPVTPPAPLLAKSALTTSGGT